MAQNKHSRVDSDMAHEYEFDQHQESLPEEIMSNQAYSSKSIGAYQRGKALKGETIEEDTYSDVDESMEKFKKRYSQRSRSKGSTIEKGASGSISVSGIGYGSTTEQLKNLEEQTVPAQISDISESMAYRKDQNVNISNLLKKNNEKMKSREID